MEMRKVQVTGGSSYIITLPKKWVRQLNIQKNDSLALLVQNDGTLLVSPKNAIGQVQQAKEIDVDLLKDPDYLFRMLVGAYVMGLSTIVVKSKKRISPPFRDTVMRFNQMAIGVEIIEETPSAIVIKDLLNPLEMPFNRTVKRMYNIVRTMHEDAIIALKKKDVSLADDVVVRDTEVNRLHWLIYRQFNMVSKDIMRFKKKGVTPGDATYYTIMGITMERIGDHAVVIAKNVPALIEKELDDKIVEAVVSSSETSLTLLDNSVDAWFRKDIDAANKNVQSLKRIFPAFEKINRLALCSKNVPYVELCYVAESVRRTGEYAGNISELVIDKVLSE